MGDLSELWTEISGTYPQITGSRQECVEWKYSVLDRFEAIEIFGELATAALEAYLDAEKKGVNLQTRTGFPPDQVDTAMEQASIAAAAFHILTKRSIESVVASRPRSQSQVIYS